jgi:hypothetical protein
LLLLLQWPSGHARQQAKRLPLPLDSSRMQHTLLLLHMVHL